MSDVIFKGSGGSNGRKPMNTAEATIIIDNSESQLAIDAPEVHVTRRVYRSGEGEYLINRQPCRLKDIKDLFRGTGAGADAYSLIEQGKIDKILSKNPEERRYLFEEAASISKFNDRKKEYDKKIEKTRENLIRVNDIIKELKHQLYKIEE